MQLILTIQFPPADDELEGVGGGEQRPPNPHHLLTGDHRLDQEWASHRIFLAGEGPIHLSVAGEDLKEDLFGKINKLACHDYFKDPF